MEVVQHEGIWVAELSAALWRGYKVKKWRTESEDALIEDCSFIV